MGAAELAPWLTAWQLDLDGEPFETHSSWLAPVSQGSVAALLKVYKPNSDERNSAAILNHWGDRASVRVFESDGGAILLERISPATSLVSIAAEDDDQATSIWCDTVEALHRKPPPAGWRDLTHCGRSLFEKPCPVHVQLSPELFERARDEFRALCDTQSERRYLLHSDLHHANVLKDDRRGWLAIDPKGYAGELEFEAASFLHNPTREYCAPRHLERRVRIVSERLGLDAERLVRWCFAHGVLSAVWSVEDTVFDPVGGLEAAHAALEVLGTIKGA